MSKEKTTGAPAPAPIAPAAPKPGGAPLAPMAPMPPKPPLPSAPKEKQAPLPNASNPGPPAAPPPIGKILKKPKKNLSQAGSHASKTGAPKARYRAQPKPKQTAPMASSGMGFLDAIKQKRKKEVKFPKYIPLSNYYQAYLNTNSNINEDEKKSENVSNNKAGVDGINWPMLDEDSDYIRVIALSDTHMGHWKLDPLFPKDGKPNPKDFIAKKGKKKKKKTKGKKVIQNNDVNAAIANNQQTIATEKEKEKEKVENVAKQTEEATTNKEKCGKMLKKILVVSGDFTNDGDLSEAKEFFEWIVNVKEKYKFDKILLTFGNHEGYSRGFANGILFKDPNSTKTTAIATNDTDSKNSTNNCNDDSSSGIRNESKNNDSSVGEIYNIDTSKINDDPYMLATARNQEYFIDSIEYFKEKVMKMKDLHFLHDESIVINGIKFYGSPWCPHLEYSVGNERKNPKYTKLFDAGFHVTAEVLRKQWKKIPYDTNYLITHTPPMGILDINKYGCYDLRMELTRLKNLQIHQFGHVHNGYGFEFVFKNDLIEKNNKALDIMQHEWKLLNKKQMMLTDQLISFKKQKRQAMEMISKNINIETMSVSKKNDVDVINETKVSVDEGRSEILRDKLRNTINDEFKKLSSEKRNEYHVDKVKYEVSREDKLPRLDLYHDNDQLLKRIKREKVDVLNDCVLFVNAANGANIDLEVFEPPIFFDIPVPKSNV